MSEYSRSLLASLAFLVLFESVVIVVADLRRPYWGDEEHYVATVHRFGRDLSLDTLKRYPELAPPLPFVLYGLWGRLVGFEIERLRALSVAMALATYLLFHRLVFDLLHRGGAAFLGTVFLAVHPYMVGFSIFVFTDTPGMLFVVLCCLGVRRSNPWLFGVAAAGAMLTRQYLAFVPLAAGAYYACRLVRRNQEDSWPMLVATGLAGVPLALLIGFWGGLGPDSHVRRLYLDEGLAFRPTHLTLYVCQLFVYLLPPVVFRAGAVYGNARVLMGSAALACLYWLFPVRPSKYGVQAGVPTVGFFHRLVRAAADDQRFEDAVFFGVLALGIPVAAYFARDCYTKWRRAEIDYAFFLDVGVLAFLVVMPFSYLAWEKYFLPLVPIASTRLLLREGDSRRRT